MMLPRRTVVVLALITGTLAGPLAAIAADADTTAPIQALNQGLIRAMQAGKVTPFAQRYSALAPVVERAFDLPAILRASVGLRWTSLAAPEQQQLLDVFRKFTICSYVANFDAFNGERIEVVPGGRSIGTDQVVQTQIVGSGDTTPINYVMHRSAEGWRAIDVLLNGSISQVAVNRSDWRALLASGAAGLITSLQRKVADLSGGAIN